MNLLEKLAEPGYTSTLITTFSCDLTYIERVVHTLKEAGSQRVMIALDADSLGRDLPVLGRLPCTAGTGYILHPVAMPHGVFHPKLILQMGPGRARLLVGSANLTASSHLGHTLEVVTELRYPPQPCSLFASALDYARRTLAPLSWAAAQFLAELPDPGPPRSAPVLLDDGTLAGFLAVPHESSLFDQLHALLRGEPVARLVVLSPFWDRWLGMLKIMQRTWTPTEGTVLLVPRRGWHLRPRRLERLDDTRACLLPEALGGRTLHAKIVVVQTAQHDHVLAGSANCTFASMGYRRGRIVNAEAGLYRRLPRGEVLSALGLEGAVEAPGLSIEALHEHIAERPPWVERAGLAPGVFEQVDNRVYWWPAPGFPPTSHPALWVYDLDDRLTEVLPALGSISGGHVFAAPIAGRVVRVQDASGFASAPAMLHVTRW